MPEEIALPGLVSLEHSFAVPLDHRDPDGPRISVFARELADPDGRNRPFLVYLQGGPGFESPRPTRQPSSPGWLDRALRDFRVLMLDQRGTGRSSPIGTLAGLSPQQQADYLSHFRADSIVLDAEWIRDELGVERWSVLGQSFGGFCVTTYLSLAPDSLREALITGGLPALRGDIDDVYRCTYRRVLERNRRYAARYPADVARIVGLRERLEREDVRLPAGDRLTWRRFRQVGAALGMSDGAERLHYLIELPPESPGFLHDAEGSVGFARNPLYAVLHEASWADGGRTRWSAQRVLPDQFRSSSLLTGEHVYPWMFEDYGALTPFREAAEVLAEREWPHLYDPGTLAANAVPVAAAVYAEDMYVERSFSEQTAAQIRGSKTWITNEYEHNGLRVDGERILGHLLDLARGRA
ncbi:MAG: alpha/beta fold hydrolase [Solirubrobacterales bacterium]|nr:alpha/beta fold hydrolase [Solirubrobacterales bacterium]MBV9715889.1 alpha/beta fold hydrolase [Solirubrobacterales bacterium]